MTTEITDTKRTTGIVKWFDSRGGFGFITILKGEENEGDDIFVHYSTLTTTSSQYKYLVLGEYVEFVLAKAENEKYKYYAQSVTGIRGGNLMCESRRLSSLDPNDVQGERDTIRVERGAVPRAGGRGFLREKKRSEDGYERVQKKSTTRQTEPSKRSYSSTVAL